MGLMGGKHPSENPISSACFIRQAPIMYLNT